MTLPKRKPKAQDAAKRWRSDAHRRWVTSTFCCAVCGAESPIEAAHVSMGSQSGTGLKTDDWRVVPLCGTTIKGEGCHQVQHRRGERSFWTEYQLRYGQSVEDLIASLCKASPKSAEIAKAQRERADG